MPTFNIRSYSFTVFTILNKLFISVLAQHTPNTTITLTTDEIVDQKTGFITKILFISVYVHINDTLMRAFPSQFIQQNQKLGMR